MMNLNSQGNRIPSPSQGESANRTDKDFRIRIGVEEVRIDAVVLNKDRHQITNLTSDDFEIRQDNSLQKITSCIYINDYQPQPQVQAGPAQDSRSIPPVPAPMPTRENVRRTIAFVVDNLTMQFDQVQLARMALQKFVEIQMQPGDLVAIVPTAGGNAALQMFSSDKRRLLSMINNVRWHIDGRTTQIMPQFMALSYCIRALSEMPGRKALITMSPQTMLPSPFINSIGSFGAALQRTASYTKDDFNKLADAALRAGVVIHTLDIHGLQGPEVYDSDFGANRGFPVDASEGVYINGRFETQPSVETYIQNKANKVRWAGAIRDSETFIPLSEKTGGLFVRDSNFFVNGIGAVNEELKGYYMLTYTPPANTFKQDSKDLYRRIKVKVKRPGSSVHTRDGFFGISQPADTWANNSDSLREAILSPFQHSDLSVHLTSGYIDDPQQGYMLQSWLHLDARNLSFVEGNDGNHSAVLEAACVTSDAGNVIQDSSNRQYDFSIKEEHLSWVKEHGLRFSLTLPVKQPGAYYVRAAVKDRASGKMGSAYQFIEIPDLKKSRLSLSNIFFINREEDLPWAQSKTPQDFKNLLYPDMQRDPRKSPALRSYLPGENFEYAAVIYNAKTDKGQMPDLESQYALFRDGKELFRSEAKALDLSGVSDFRRIPIRKMLTLNKAIQPGDYMLQVRITDKRADRKSNLATQALDFQVIKN
jgi:VWFA-related protein